MVAPRNRTLFLDSHDRLRYPVEPLGPQLQWNRIYRGDALAGLSRLPSASVHLVFADPPYDRGADLEWNDSWIRECARVLRPDGSIYVCSDWKTSGVLQQILKTHFIVRNRITWRREKGRGAVRNWKNTMEDIWFATKGKRYPFTTVKWKKSVLAPYRDPRGRPKDWIQRNGERYRWTHPSNIWIDLCVPFWSMPENTPHPYQKPEKLVERILKSSSHRGDRVLDPFMGSGTTAVVARRLGRRFLGFEINKDYVRLALKRLDLRG